MGSDLASVCVFCAAALLRTGLPPFPGTSADLGGAYSTLQRRYDIDTARDDISNVTPKFVLDFTPKSSARATIVDLAVRQAIGSGVRLRLSLQATYGAETVTLTDAKGSRPSRRLNVDWIGAGGKGSGGAAGFLGSPAFAIGLLADFVVGRSGR